MLNATRVPMAAAVRLGGIALLLFCWLPAGMGAESANSVITIMTRNMDAGTDLGYVFAGTDENSFVQGMAATLDELTASGFQQRAAALASEIQAKQPDLIALQEVTLWRTGTYMQPPATTVLYDQLDMLQAELKKLGLHYGVVAVQTEIDAEAPVPSAGEDLRMTDRDVILARLDLPQSQFDLVNAETHRFKAVFSFGNPLLGHIPVPCGWIEVDVTANGAKFHFVNTHLQGTIPGVPEAERVQLRQIAELLSNIKHGDDPIVLAGDFNSNAEPGPEHTGAVEKIVSAGFVDTWDAEHPYDPGFTWPLFGEDQKSGVGVPNERIDLIFASGPMQRWLSRTNPIVSAELTGTTPSYASDHAGLVVKLTLK